MTQVLRSITIEKMHISVWTDACTPTTGYDAIIPSLMQVLEKRLLLDFLGLRVADTAIVHQVVDFNRGLG